MHRAENREDDQADENEMEVRDQIITVLGLPIERGDRVADARQAGEEKLHERRDAKEHRRGKSQPAADHRRAPVEHLHPGRNRDQQAGSDEKQIHRVAEPDGEHVMRPHEQAQKGDRDRRAGDEFVTEDRLARENRNHLRQNSERRQRDDINLRMPEGPENVLPHDRGTAAGRQEKMRPSSWRSISSITSPALSTGSARMTRKELTNIIHENSGSRRSVMFGARCVSTVTMKLMDVPTEPMPSTSNDSAQIVHAQLRGIRRLAQRCVSEPADGRCAAR